MSTTETTIGRDGIERWDDGTPVSQNNAFRVAPDGMRIDVAKMAQAARNSAATSRAVSRDAAAGRGRGTIAGISRKADANMVKGIPDVYAGKESNFASMKRKGMPQR